MERVAATLAPESELTEARADAPTLQRAIGNRAFGRLLSRQPKPPGADKFAAEIGADAAQRGQFVLTGAARRALSAKVTSAIWDQEGFGGDTQLGVWQAWESYNRQLARHDFAAAEKEAKSLAGFAKSVPGPGPAALAACRGEDAQATQGAGAAAFETVWKEYGKAGGGAAPDVKDSATMLGVIGILRWEIIACKATTEKLGKKVAAGRAKRDPAKAIKEQSLAERIDPDPYNEDDGRIGGDVITYAKGLGVMVGKIRTALDDGYTVHARVISGAHALKDGRSPDHSILIYGHDGANELYFFDADVKGTDLAGSGFGRLYYDPQTPRLSTAKTEDDFPAWSEREQNPGGRQGFQKSGVHRYQVKDIWTM